MSVVFSSPNPVYRQVLAADLSAANDAGSVAGQWVYTYDTEVLRFVKESANALSYGEVLSFDGGALTTNRRFGTGTIPANQYFVDVANTSVTANSVILITAIDVCLTVGGTPVYFIVIGKNAGVGFTLELQDFAGAQVNTNGVPFTFNYLIIN